MQSYTLCSACLRSKASTTRAHVHAPALSWSCGAACHRQSFLWGKPAYLWTGEVKTHSATLLERHNARPRRRLQHYSRDTMQGQGAECSTTREAQWKVKAQSAALERHSARLRHRVQKSVQITAEWVQNQCRFTAELLQIYCRINAELLQNRCRISAELLQNYCRITAELLQNYWRITAELL